MRAMKRTVSVVLALVMVLGMMTMAISVSAAETNQITATSNFADSYSVDYNANAKQVTVTYTFKTALKVVNFEGTATYDSSVLQLSEATFPGFNGEAVANTEEYENAIYVNASNTNGYDFTGDGVAIANFVFNIVGTGNTTVNFDINEMTATTAVGTGEANDVDVFDESAATGDQAYTATATVTTDVPAVSGDDFVKANALNLEGKVGVRYLFQIPEQFAGKTVKAVMSSDFVEDVVEVPFDSTTWNKKAAGYIGTYYVASFDLTRDITTKFYVDNEYVAENKFSAKGWIDRVLAGTNERQKSIAKALAAYGAASQIYFHEDLGTDTNYSKLANEGIDYTVPTVTANDITVNTYTTPDLSAYGVGSTVNNSLILDADTAIRDWFQITNQAKLDAASVAIKEKATGTVKEEDASYTASKRGGVSYAIFEVKDIASFEYGKDFSVVFGGSAEYTTSVNAIIKKILAGNGTQNYKNLAMALYNYGVVAEGFFG